MEIKNYIHIDFTRGKDIVVPSIQYDSGTRWVMAKLYDNGLPIDLKELKVCIMAVKSDGKEVFNECKIIDAEKGIIEFEITKQMGILVGEVECQIKLFGPDQLLSSNIFKLSVTKTLSPSSESSKDELDVLVNALGQVQDIDNRFAQTNAQLSLKANTSDVRRNDVAIKLEDLHTEVKQAMTGGSVAVVGENAVGNENVKNKAIDCTKINDTVATASLVNLFNTNFRTNVSVMAATMSESEGVYSIVTSESYGRLDIRLDNVVGSSKFLMMCKVKATDSTSVNKNVSLICYNYSSTGANLGQNYSGPVQPLTSDWRTIITTDIVLNEQATRGVFGVMSPNSSYQVKDIVICRIDDIPIEMLNLIDFKKINSGYWYSSLGGYYPASMTSNHSQYSELAKTVEDGAITPQKLSQTYLTGCTNVIKTSDYRGTGKNGATVSYDESTGIHTITSNTTYGTFNRRLSTKEGKRYVMVSEVRSTTNDGLAIKDTIYCYQGSTNLGNSGYNNVTVNVSSEWSIHTTKVIESKPNADRIDIGLCTGVDGASFEVRRQFIFDVSDLTVDLIEDFDFEALVVGNS